MRSPLNSAWTLGTFYSPRIVLFGFPRCSFELFARLECIGVEESTKKEPDQCRPGARSFKAFQWDWKWWITCILRIWHSFFCCSWQMLRDNRIERKRTSWLQWWTNKFTGYHLRSVELKTDLSKSFSMVLRLSGWRVAVRSIWNMIEEENAGKKTRKRISFARVKLHDEILKKFRAEE